MLASGVAVEVERAVDSVETCDIVIVPSLVLRPQGWVKGRHPRLTEWLAGMHARGAVLCSACSGIFVLAETGLFDGRDATVHFGYARPFAAAYPAVTIQLAGRLRGRGLFRRLFKRTTGLAPGAYRRRFCIPGFACPARESG